MPQSNKKGAIFFIPFMAVKFNQFHANCMQNIHLVNAVGAKVSKRMPATDMKIMLIVFFVFFYLLFLSLRARLFGFLGWSFCVD